jgi:eukaryotic-like serine/threonine-protein kinase
MAEAGTSGIDGRRWQRIQALFHDAAALPSAERAPFLEQACADDAPLRQKVEGMLREDELGSCILDRGLAEVAEAVLQKGDAVVGARQLGRYRIERKLGEGGMGVVYLAQREDLGSVVAIKLLRDSWVSSERRARFAKEQRFLASLEHPSIARLYDADTLEDGTPYFVMEYVEGAPLTSYCEQQGTTLAQRLGLFHAVCEAVRYAHALALIHRDLKPANVFVKADGSVRLLDFGIAKQVERADSGPAERTQGLSFMTPAYAAPEQLRGTAVGVYTDIYSLGVMLYELLTGQLPFDTAASTASQLLEAVTGAPARKPSEVAATRHNASELTRAEWADLDVLVACAMHVEPQRRYRSVDALLRDLDHFARHEPLEARPDSWRYRLGKFARRHRVALRLGATALVLLVALVSFFTFRLAKARDEALAEVARTQRIERFMKQLFSGDEAEVGPADDLRVVTLLDRGAREARALDRDPQVQAEMFQTLGTIYGDLSRFGPAEALLAQALEQRRRLFGKQSTQAGESLVALALMRLEQARFAEAEQLVREAVEIQTRALPPMHPAVARAQAALGHVLIGRGSYKAAISILTEVVARLTARGDQPLELRFVVSDLANAQFYLGNFDESRVLNLRLLELDKQTLGAQHANVADDLINLAAIHTERGTYAEAERLNREALVITERWFGPDQPMTASNLTLLGRALNHEGKDLEAISVLTRALRINERSYPANHPSIASTLNDLGIAARNLKRYDEAQAYLQRMLDIERALHGDDHERVGVAIANLATVDSERGDFTSAEKRLREALAIYAKRGFTDHVRSGFARISLGHALLGEKRYAEALTESRAGYDIMLRHKSLTSTAIPIARRDIPAALTALGRDAEAAAFRADLPKSGAELTAPGSAALR